MLLSPLAFSFFLLAIPRQQNRVPSYRSGDIRFKWAKPLSLSACFAFWRVWTMLSNAQESWLFHHLLAALWQSAVVLGIKVGVSCMQEGKVSYFSDPQNSISRFKNHHSKIWDEKSCLSSIALFCSKVVISPSKIDWLKEAHQSPLGRSHCYHSSFLNFTGHMMNPGLWHWAHLPRVGCIISMTKVDGTLEISGKGRSPEGSEMGVITT